MTLFALTDEPSARIARVPLSDPLREEVEALFRQQEAEFRSRTEQEIIFDGKYKPDFNECLVIDGFDDIDGLKEAITNSLSVPVIAPTQQALNSVKALFTGSLNSDGSCTILIQNFEKRRIIATGGWLTLVFEDSQYKRFDTVGLTVDNKLSMVLDGNRLKFFSFFYARQVFDLTQHFTVATDQDIRDFIELPIIKAATAERFFENSDTWVRRKVALIKQSGVLEDFAPVEIKRIGTEFGVNINVLNEDGKDVIILPDDKAELKKVLRFLDEDYYKSSIRSLLHLTNSKVKL